MNVIEPGERVGRYDPEIIVEDHLTEHSLASQQHRDVPVEAVAPSQHYYVWVTLNYNDNKNELANLSPFLVDMIHKCLLILEVVCNVGDSKTQLLQSLIMKEASILFVEIGNVAGIQWYVIIAPILGRRNSDTETVISVECIFGWSRSCVNII